MHRWKKLIMSGMKTSKWKFEDAASCEQQRSQSPPDFQVLTRNEKR